MNPRLHTAIGGALMLASSLPLPRAAAGQAVAIAMCQIVVLDGDREGNFVRIENAVREAAAARADIACFPESAILGWVNTDEETSSFPPQSVYISED